MVRRACGDDLAALTAFRCEAFGASPAEAEGWFTGIIGLENVLLLTKDGEILSMVGAAPLTLRERRGVLFCGMATRAQWRGRGLMTRLLAGCIRAYAATGCSFAVTVPKGRRAAQGLARLGFADAFPMRLVERPIAKNLWAQAEFDSLTVPHLCEQRLRFQPGCIVLPEKSMVETVRQLYSRGITIASNARAYGLFYTAGDILQWVELQAENDHSADILLQAAREKTGAQTARILLGDSQPLYLGEGKRRGYAMLRFLDRQFPVKDVYFRLLLGE